MLSPSLTTRYNGKMEEVARTSSGGAGHGSWQAFTVTKEWITIERRSGTGMLHYENGPFSPPGSPDLGPLGSPDLSPPGPPDQNPPEPPDLGPPGSPGEWARAVVSAERRLVDTYVTGPVEAVPGQKVERRYSAGRLMSVREYHLNGGASPPSKGSRVQSAPQHSTLALC